MPTTRQPAKTATDFESRVRKAVAAIVRMDISLAGFFGKISGEPLTQKQLLLEQEGVCFDSAGRVEERFVRRMP